jgi:hypothetical protein
MPAIATGKEKIGFTVCVIRNYILFDWLRSSFTFYIWY